MTAPFDELTEVAVVDCETTGVDPTRDRIVSLAVVLVDLSQDSTQKPTTYGGEVESWHPHPRVRW